MQTTHSDSVEIAKRMIQRHGLQAGAIAQQREAMARLAPDPQALDLWRSVQRSIAEFRGPAPPRPAA